MSRRSSDIARVQREMADITPDEFCAVYWGSHGCDKRRGHDGPHVCTTCYDPKDTAGYVGYPPYYGPDTYFYGEDSPDYFRYDAAAFPALRAAGVNIPTGYSTRFSDQS